MKYILYYKYYFCRVLDKMGLLKYFSFFFKIKVGSKRMHIPVTGGHGYYNLYPFKEAWMETLVQKCMAEREGSIIDVGVNLGQTLLKIAALNSQADYYGFEPNPVCYTYCKELLKRNKLVSFKVLPVGLSDEAAVVKLYGDNDHASGATVVDNFRNDTKRYAVIHHVPVMRGDIVLNNEPISKINFVKIDVEGAELEVIEGLQETLLKHSPLIIMEILPVYSADSPNGKMRMERQDQLLQLMFNMQYSLFLILEEEVRLQRLNNIAVHGNMGTTNYLFIPEGEEIFFKSLIVK
jgi:FkbM family methyltransferase